MNEVRSVCLFPKLNEFTALDQDPSISSLFQSIIQFANARKFFKLIVECGNEIEIALKAAGGLGVANAHFRGLWHDVWKCCVSLASCSLNSTSADWRNSRECCSFKLVHLTDNTPTFSSSISLSSQLGSKEECLRETRYTRFHHICIQNDSLRRLQKPDDRWTRPSVLGPLCCPFRVTSLHTFSGCRIRRADSQQTPRFLECPLARMLGQHSLHSDFDCCFG